MSKDTQASYYDVGGIETLDVIKAKLTREQYQGYLLGNAIKYQCRVMHKTHDNPLRDAEKAANYSKWFSEFVAASNYLPDDSKMMIDLNKLDLVLKKLAHEAKETYTGIAVIVGMVDDIVYRLEAVEKTTANTRRWVEMPDWAKCIIEVKK